MRAAKLSLHPGLVRLLGVALLCLACARHCVAGVPRFISGDGWGVSAGRTVSWPQTTLLYFTDGGDLNANVSHADADQMVAAAAAVWNVPTSSINLAQGGQLGEDVSTDNTVSNGQGVTFPADVQTSNERAVPVAILYDATGGLIDLLLGSGASEPDACRQNAVVGDIDDIHQNDASIRHATLILNGRCVGSAPEQLTQMQYQLARSFGRILGLAWSQTNDNVFTAQTTVTANQVAHWPLMHPLDVICGNYSYQCMSNPFTLRDEDLNTLAHLYPVPESAATNGKRGSSDDARYLWGILYFPTGQGMGWTNITVHRLNRGFMEDWQTTSSMTGYDYLQSIATPVNSQPVSTTGGNSSGLDGYFEFRRIPCDGVSDLYFTSEAINPLYTGDAAIGPYVRPPVVPSGSPATYIDFSAFSYGDNEVTGFLTANNATSTCSAAGSGTETQPAALDPSGWQPGQLCAWGTNAWWNVTIAPRHSWSLEVTATDETGASTVNKLQPVLGVWRAGDAPGTLPTVTGQTVPFNSLSLGMTQLRMNSTSAAQSFRLSLSDQYGAGRPDFTYVARLLYAADVSPAVIPSGGGRITITGTGFRQGNSVLINGAPATLVSLTATQIVANAPAMATAGTRAGLSVDLAVRDTATGGSSAISRAVRYVQLPNQLIVAAAPSTLKTGIPSAQPITLRVVSADGVAPVAGASVTLKVTAGSAQLGSCGAVCTLVTDADGLAASSVTGLAAGPVTLVATENSGGATVGIAMVDEDPVRSASYTSAGGYVAQGAATSWQLQANFLQDSLPAESIPVTWTASPGLTLQTAQAASAANGLAAASIALVPGTPAGSQTLTACAWDSVCTTWTVTVVPNTQWKLAALTPSTPGPARQLTLAVTDAAGHPLQGAPVYLYQRVLAWTPACPAQDRCPAAQVLAASQTTLTSDSSGLVQATPLAVEDVPQTLQAAAATGSDGFATWTASVPSQGN